VGVTVSSGSIVVLGESESGCMEAYVAGEGRERRTEIPES
jgi:hypothetical protein